MSGKLRVLLTFFLFCILVGIAPALPAQDSEVASPAEGTDRPIPKAKCCNGMPQQSEGDGGEPVTQEEFSAALKEILSRLETLHQDAVRSTPPPPPPPPPPIVERRVKPKKIKGPGEILVGNPEVVTRERLVNDRLKQELWLEGQLDLVERDDFTFGFQGLSDLRSFFGLSAKLGVEADTNLLNIYDGQTAATLAELRRAEEQAALQNQINTLEKHKAIRELQEAQRGRGVLAGQLTPVTPTKTTDADSDGDASAEGNTGADGSEEQPPPPPPPSEDPTNPSTVAGDITLDFLTRLTQQGRALTKSANPTESTATAHPRDLFRDRLAYREEVRNEIFENALDDRHDLKGNTAYRINMDVSILPKKKQDAWAVVEVTVERPGTDMLSDERLRQWKIDLSREINERLLRDLQAAIPCYGGEPKGGSGADDTPPKTGCLSEELEREIFDHFQRSILGRFQEGQEELTQAGMLKSDAAAGQQREIEHVYLETLKEVLRGGPVTTQKTPEEEKLFLHANMNAAIKAIRKIAETGNEECLSRLRNARRKKLMERTPEACPQEPQLDDSCSTNLGALAYLLAGYYENYYSDIQGLKKYVSIPKVACGKYPHLTVNPIDEKKQEFRKYLRERERVYAFAATPKETVQRISEVANRRSTIELAAALHTRTTKGSAEAILESERLLHGIRRQPLVVGFTEAENTFAKSKRSDVAVAGWILGPKFKLEDSTWTLPWNKGFHFEHAPMQHNLAFTISVPEWWTEAKITIRRYWRTPKGKRLGEAEETISHIIELPGTLQGITKALLEYRLPAVAHQQAWDVTVNKEARLLISGSDLWRSTRVTLGGQIAEAIEVLPSMEGIVATFKEVKEPAAIDGKSPRSGVPVRVWTSEGHQQAGTATIHAGKPPTPRTLKVKVDPPRLVQDQTLTLKVTEGSLAAKRESLAIQIFGKKADGKAIAVYLQPVTYKETDKTLEVALAKDLVKDLTDQSLVQVQLLITETEGGAPKAVNAEKAVPFYTTTPKIAWTARAGTTNDRIDGIVKLTTPKFMETAFPGFGRDSQLVFKVEAGNPLELATTQWSKLSDGTFEVESTFKTLKGIATGATVAVTPAFKDVALQKITFNPTKRSLKRP